MRQCPTVEGSEAPLITHRIASAACLTRQATNFHKCHRCIYRGQAADWRPADSGERGSGADFVIPRPEKQSSPAVATGS